MKYLDNTGLSYLWSKIKPLINAKQDALVSGTNIKTINNTSVLGNGNINIIDAIYPVGSIYMSVNNTSPTTLFGGTWVQIEDTFLLAAGTNHSAGTTGGEETHTLTTQEMPTHNHTFTGTAHSHGLNSHTHTYDKSATATGAASGNTGAASGNTGAASGNTGSTTLTIDQIPAHNHDMYVTANPNTGGTGIRGSFNGNEGSKQSAYSMGIGTGNKGGGQGHTHSLNSHTHSLNSHTHSLNNHTHTITLTSTNSGKASGNTAEATQGGTIGNAGSGNAHNNMPPYLAVYVWKRTA